MIRKLLLMTSLKSIWLAFMIFLTTCAHGQVFLNGSFEDNTAPGDQINVTNAVYNSLVNNSIAFGSYNGGGLAGGNMDIIGSANYCASPAQDGSWYVALTGGGTDAISLELSSPLITGNLYTITYFDRHGFLSNNVPHPFYIGVSISDTIFGTTVFTSPIPDSCGWSMRSFSFISPDTCRYITAKLSAGGPTTSWCHLDNFSFEGATSTDSEQEKVSYRVFPNPAREFFTVTNDKGADAVSKIRLWSVFGQVLSEHRPGIIDISNLPPGIYLAELQTEDHSTFIKFIKE